MKGQKYVVCDKCKQKTELEGHQTVKYCPQCGASRKHLTYEYSYPLSQFL